MTISVNDNRLKIYHAKYGYNNLFGKDVDERKRMTDEQLIERFDTVWRNSLNSAVAKADRCDADDARRKLKSDQQSFVKDDQDQREFWLEGGLFIAQLSIEDKTTQELTQLWFIKSSNVDPRTLFITFDTVNMREEFARLAQQLRYKDDELGKKLLLDFMETVLRKSVRD